MTAFVHKRPVGIFDCMKVLTVNGMLKYTEDLGPQVNFAVDILGLATKYDFTIKRWGTMSQDSCIVDASGKDAHDQWLAMDVELLNDDIADQFATDALMAGIKTYRKGLVLHLTPFTLPDTSEVLPA